MISSTRGIILFWKIPICSVYIINISKIKKIIFEDWNQTIKLTFSWLTIENGSISSNMTSSSFNPISPGISPPLSGEEFGLCVKLDRRVVSRDLRSFRLAVTLFLALLHFTRIFWNRFFFFVDDDKNGRSLSSFDSRWFRAKFTKTWKIEMIKRKVKVLN